MRSNSEGDIEATAVNSILSAFEEVFQQCDKLPKDLRNQSWADASENTENNGEDGVDSTTHVSDTLNNMDDVENSLSPVEQ